MSNYSLTGYDSADLLAPASGLDRFAAAACHGALVFGLPFLLPLGIFFLYPLVSPSAYVRNQALQALLFHAFFLFVTTVTTYVLFATFLFGVLGFVFHPLLLSWPAALAVCVVGGALTLWCLVVMCIATFQALVGHPYRVPVVGRWIH